MTLETIRVIVIECRQCKITMRAGKGDSVHREFKCDMCGAEIDVTYMPLSAKLAGMRPRKTGIG